MKFRYVVYGATVLSLTIQGAVREVRAEKPFPILSDQSTAKDVLRLWGAPVERVEQETKRQETWIYGESYVTLQAGKVVAWKDARRAQEPSPPTAQEKEKVRADRGKSIEDLPVEALLNDIIGEPEKGQ